MLPRASAPRRGTARSRFLSALASTGTIFVLLLILWVWITILNPTFAEPGPFLAYLKRSAPLVILAAGAYFVLISGNFDLSVGSLVTVIVVVAARVIDNEPSRMWPVIALLLAIGVIVGFVNGFISTVLRVPSFITTLGHAAHPERSGVPLDRRRPTRRAVGELPLDRTSGDRWDPVDRAASVVGDHAWS